MTAKHQEQSGIVAGEFRGVHHVGVPVRSLERSLAWYADLFGLRPEFVAPAEGPALSQTVSLENARLRFAFLPVGNAILELLEYEHPVGAEYDRHNCDVGATHLCFEVSDIERVYRLLSARGVPFSIRPTTLGNPLEGHKCCYLRDPDGIPIELWQRPDPVSD